MRRKLRVGQVISILIPAGRRLAKSARILAAINEYYFGSEMDAKEIVARMSQYARAEHGDYLSYDEERGLTVDYGKMLADGKGHLIKEIGYLRSGVQVVKFPDSQASLRDMARVRGLFKDTTVNLDVDVAALSDQDLDELLERL